MCLILQNLFLTVLCKRFLLKGLKFVVIFIVVLFRFVFMVSIWSFFKKKLFRNSKIQPFIYSFVSLGKYSGLLPPQLR